MVDATFTTLLSATRTDDCGNVYIVSIIHRSAGTRGGDEAWIVRRGDVGMPISTFYGRTFADKPAALAAYNAGLPVVVAVAEVAA